MDPKACLETAGVAYASGENDDAWESLNAYRDWRARGGFEPILESGMRGDEFANKLRFNLYTHAK